MKVDSFDEDDNPCNDHFDDTKSSSKMLPNKWCSYEVMLQKIEFSKNIELELESHI